MTGAIEEIEEIGAATGSSKTAAIGSTGTGTIGVIGTGETIDENTCPRRSIGRRRPVRPVQRVRRLSPASFSLKVRAQIN